MKKVSTAKHLPPFARQPDWKGISFTSMDVGRPKGADWTVNGYAYATEGEALLATLLAKKGIPFTPNVRIMVRLPGKGRSLIVPDFVFNGRTYLWRSKDRWVPFHGIEAKGQGASPRTQMLHQLLWEQRGIRIIVLTEAQIRMCVAHSFRIAEHLPKKRKRSAKKRPARRMRARKKRPTMRAGIKKIRPSRRTKPS